MARETTKVRRSPVLSRSSNHVAHATALVQKAEKEAALCDAAVDTLNFEVEKMQEALERAQQKAQAASASSNRRSVRGNHHLLMLASVYHAEIPHSMLKCTPKKAFYCLKSPFFCRWKLWCLLWPTRDPHRPPYSPEDHSDQEDGRKLDCQEACFEASGRQGEQADCRHGSGSQRAAQLETPLPGPQVRSQF